MVLREHKRRDQFDATVGRKGREGTLLECRVAPGRQRLVDLIYSQGWAPSKSEARRLIQQGAVELDGEKIADPNYELVVEDGRRHDIKVGKKIKCFLKGVDIRFPLCYKEHVLDSTSSLFFPKIKFTN